MSAFFSLWILFTLGLYHFGAIPWSGQGSGLVSLVVLGSVLAFQLGVMLGRRLEPLGGTGGGLVVGYPAKLGLVILWMLLSAIHIQGLTGLNIFNPADYSLDFGNIYASFQETAGDITRYGMPAILQLAILAKAMVFVFVLVILAGDFRERPLLVALILFPMVGSSMMRGTDREIADLTILIIILCFYHRLLQRRAILLIALVPLMLVLFLVRRIGRFDGFMPRCIPDSIVCFNTESWIGRTIDPSAEYFWMMFTNYLTQGYEALYRAMSLPFEWGFGIGHLTVVKSLSCSMVRLGCDISGFEQKLVDVGLDTQRFFTSAYVNIANDTHWLLLPLYFGLMGMLFGVSERSWKERRDRISLAAVLLISIFMIYSPINMQLGKALEWSVALIGIMGFQLFRLAIRGRSTVPAGISARG